ncbi:hypothetical protein HGB25_03115 [Candidatus Saccharibacteria bacterium]|nr:hypothetical protein [Candidatus Saccharibacteria bacterium]
MTYQAETSADERHFIASDIQRRLNGGEKADDIAVLTRRHHEISKLLPYFAHMGISVNYERRDNVLEIPIIIYIEKLAQLIINLARGNYDEVSILLPEVISDKSWGIKPHDICKLSLMAYEKRSSWIEVMAETDEFMEIHKWLVKTSTIIFDTPLEQMLDIIIGKPNTKDDTVDFKSPIYNYYFSKNTMVENPNQYLNYLEALRKIRQELRDYRTDQIPTLITFIDFIRLNRKIGATISITRRFTQSDTAINVMTAHKSKGLEFNTVYVTNAVDTVWGERARSRNRLINYPENLPLAPAGENEDERLRLFYVAMTRARQDLLISYSSRNDSGKETLPASFLVNSQWDTSDIKPSTEVDMQIEASELDWYDPIIKPSNGEMRELLLPSLENYKLSVTHLHNFLDVSRGGPSTFLVQNLLKFPTAKSPNAAYGTAIHNTLQGAHMHMSSSGDTQAIEDIISKYEVELTNQHLAKSDFQHFLEKGSDVLRVFLDQKYSTFNQTQQTELDFSNQHSISGEAHITGKIDLSEVDRTNKVIDVIDYKTGKPATSWNGHDEHEKIKLHKYRQQLLFYKLLVENARDYRGYKVDMGTIQFVEPTRSGGIVSLSTDFNEAEISRFEKLVNAVWSRIKTLNLPDISEYDPSYKGILAFEQDLIDKNT